MVVEAGRTAEMADGREETGGDGRRKSKRGGKVGGEEQGEQ